MSTYRFHGDAILLHTPRQLVGRDGNLAGGARIVLSGSEDGLEGLVVRCLDLVEKLRKLH